MQEAANILVSINGGKVIKRRGSYMVGKTYNDLKMYYILFLKLQNSEQKFEDATDKIRDALVNIVRFWKQSHPYQTLPAKFWKVSAQSIRKKLRSMYLELETDWWKNFSKMEYSTLAKLSTEEKDSLEQYLEKRWLACYEHHMDTCPPEEKSLLNMLKPDIVLANIVN
jgi:small-conductance mechanosensitive channel